MADEEFPEDVRDFLYEHIESYEQLAVVMLLHSHPGEALDANTVALETRLPNDLAKQALEELCVKELVKATAYGSSLKYARAASTAPTVARLAACYESRPLEIMSLMNANAIQRLRSSMVKSFANAFIVGKKKKDG